jgi:hypothetical protein
MHGGDEKCVGYKNVIEEPEGKRPVWAHRRILEGIIKSYIGETKCERLDWIQLAQVRFQWRTGINTVMSPYFYL